MSGSVVSVSYLMFSVGSIFDKYRLQWMIEKIVTWECVLKFLNGYIFAPSAIKNQIWLGYLIFFFTQRPIKYEITYPL